MYFCCVVSHMTHFQPICHTIRQKSLTWTRKLSIQLYLAHVARNYNKQSQCHFNSVDVKVHKASQVQQIRLTLSVLHISQICY